MLKRLKIRIPILLPLKEDIPAIIASIVKVNPQFGTACLSSTSDLSKATDIFYDKLSSPREINGALEKAYMSRLAYLEQGDIARYAQMELMQSGSEAAIYTEYLALKYTSSQQYYPWYGKRTFTLPDHISTVLNSDGETIDYSLLDQKIADLKSQMRI